MFDWGTKMGCRNYRARLESYVAFAGDRPLTDEKLDAHLRDCTSCRLALDEALLASELLRGVRARTPAVQPSEGFSVRVMAAIRTELSLRKKPETIWRPLELLGSKFALGAAAALLLFSLYLVEFAPSSSHQPPAVATQTEVGNIIPEGPAPPSDAEEILISLIERENEL